MKSCVKTCKNLCKAYKTIKTYKHLYETNKSLHEKCIKPVNTYQKRIKINCEACHLKNQFGKSPGEKNRSTPNGFCMKY